jgi:hypothetical protein
MVTPPAGAAIFKVIVPTAAVSFITEPGSMENEVIVSGGVGRTVIEAVLLELFNLTTIVASLDELTLIASISKVAEVWPASTFRVGGTCTGEPKVDNTCSKGRSAGAGPLKLTVPTAEDPPITEVGDMAKSDKAGMAEAGLVVSKAVLLILFNFIVMAVSIGAVTSLVLISKAAEISPDLILTLPGSVTGAPLAADSVSAGRS